MLRSVTKDDRAAVRASMLPKDARPILEAVDGSAFYYYERAGRPYAIAFIGTAGRPHVHCWYRTEEERAEDMLRWKSARESSQVLKDSARAERSAWSNPLKVGDLLYTSWGYDQTNVEFYAVTRVAGRRVHVREIAADSSASGTSVWPAMPITFSGPETVHTAQPNGASGAMVKISGSRRAYQHDGNPKSCSGPYGGH